MEGYISWNIPNWITIVLMAALGFMILSLGAQLWHNRAASSSSGS